jgi:hypothetical protein
MNRPVFMCEYAKLERGHIAGFFLISAMMLNDVAVISETLLNIER